MTEYYQAAIWALKTGRFISTHAMLKDLEEGASSCIWFDSEHAEIEIEKARKDYENK